MMRLKSLDHLGTNPLNRIEAGGQSSDYILEKVELNHIGRFIEPVDIRTLVSGIEIYEHLDKPYLSGNIILTDFSKVYNRADLQGAENLSIAFKKSKNGPIYEKMFIIDLVETKKLNDNTENIMLHLTEEIAFKSNLYNVNRSYRGKPSNIISNIASQFLSKVVNIIGEDNYQGDMNVIVPNMNPLESMIWIKNRATDKDGYPYFLFSTLANDELYLLNLSDMLHATPTLFNAGTPRPQLSSCFLEAMESDSIDGIYNMHLLYWVSTSSLVEHNNHD